MDAGTQNHQSVTTESDFELLPFLRSPGCVLVFAFCSLVGGCFYSLANSDAIREMAVFDCGKGREIVFLKSGECDESQPIYYEVCIDGETIVPMTDVALLSCDPGELLFDIRKAADGNVVGIVQLTSSGIDFWVVHDFRERASWPAGDMRPEFRGSGKFTREDLEDLLRQASKREP